VARPALIAIASATIRIIKLYSLLTGKNILDTPMATRPMPCKSSLGKAEHRRHRRITAEATIEIQRMFVVVVRRNE
jgi:hypothetical protein